MKKMGLTTRVVLMTLSIFLGAVSLLSWHQARNEREEAQKALLAQQYARVAYIANSLEAALQVRLQALVTVAHAITPEMLRQPRQMQAYLAVHKPLGRVFNLGMYAVAADGQGIADFPVMEGRAAANYAQREYFRETLATGKPVIGKPVLGRFAKKPVLLIAVPVLDQANRVAAVLVGANQIFGSDLFNEVQSSTASNLGELHIISIRHRIFIASTDPTRVLQPIAAPGVNQLLDRYLQGYEGSGTMLDSRRIEALSSASHVATPGWVVEVFLPTSVAFAASKARQLDIYRDAALATAVLTLILGLFLRRQVAPLRTTAALLNEMGSGQLPPRAIPVAGAPEIQQVQKSFNFLQQQLAEKEAARQRADEDLRQSEMKYRAVFDHAGDAIFIHNESGMLAVNPTACERLGYSHAELMSLATGGVDAPDQAPQVPGRIARLMEQGQLTFETVHLRKDGSPVPTEVNARFITWEGQPAIMSICRNISERKRAEEALQAKSAELERYFTSSLDLLCIANVHGHFIRVNPEWEKVLGYSVQKLEGKSFLDLVHPDDMKGTLAAMSLLSAQEPVLRFENRYRCEDGSYRWIEWRSQPQGDLIYAAARDITERKRAEEEKLKLQTQLQQVQKMESLGSLAGGVAHDMNNVLGAILGMASANIEAHPAGSPAYRAFDTISQAAVRGGKMVKSLLSFARQSPAEDRVLDMNEILQEEVRMLERTTLAKVRLELDLARGLRPISGDASALTHAVMNLCVNAVDAMPENGTLTLRTRNVDNDWIEIVVEDTGTGMPREVLEKAMDPFFTTKEVGKGTGLGLSMVYSTVTAHRGQLELQSEPGQGTRVRLRFPACEAVAQPLELTAKPQAETSRRPLNVLVVDDDELIQGSTLAILEVLGHRATGVACGEEALARLKAGFEPDVVILDMNMPGLGGAGTLPRLRALNPTVPVVLATGRVDEFALKLAGAHPHVALLSKPFSISELKKHLEPLEGERPAL